VATVKTVVRDKDGLIVRTIETDERDPLLPRIKELESARDQAVEQYMLLDTERQKEITALKTKITSLQESNAKSERMVAGLLVELRKSAEALENLREAQRRRFTEAAAFQAKARERQVRIKRRKLVASGFDELAVEHALRYEANS